ncbi:MAG TPA: OB-fold nucleic acid binding domain-containing protein, partial [Anaerolineaceae bacterium]|nr:OB-fold nucleic acid binding domain-containing protein [Anaerolineaceae bacterium]
MELSELEKIRLEKIEKMRAAGVEPYPTRAEVNQTCAEAIQRFEAAEAAGNTEGLSAILGGRLRAVRTMGKLAFAHIEDGTGRIQLFLRVNELGEETMQRFKDHFDLGDYIQAEGNLVRTRTGEISLQVHDFKMLAKAIIPLPAAKDE